MFHYTDMKWTATGVSNFPDCNVQILTNIFSIDFVAYSTSGAFNISFYRIHDSDHMDRN